jgi:hypothetical protein
MNDKIKQLTAELEAYQAKKALLQREADTIKLEIKAEERKIKAVQSLIDAINANTEQTEG